MTFFVQLGEWFGFDGTYWSPFIYQYGVGLILMAVGIWAGSRNGVWPKGRRLWLIPVIGGWFFFMFAQGAFQKQGTPQDPSLTLASCPPTSFDTEYFAPSSNVCVELGYRDSTRKNFTFDHRTKWDDLSGDPNDLFTVQFSYDKAGSLTQVSVVPTGKGVGTATLKVAFSHSHLTAEVAVTVVKGDGFTITAGTEAGRQPSSAEVVFDASGEPASALPNPGEDT